MGLGDIQTSTISPTTCPPTLILQSIMMVNNLDFIILTLLVCKGCRWNRLNNNYQEREIYKYIFLNY